MNNNNDDDDDKKLCALYKIIKFCEINAIINTIYKVSKPRHKEVKYLAQSNTPSKWQT